LNYAADDWSAEPDRGRRTIVASNQEEYVMASIFKLKDLSFEHSKSPIPEFLWHTSPNLSKAADAQHIQFYVRSLDSGKFSFPYHFHRNAEELFVILTGSAMLRTPDGFRELTEGDVVFFEMGSSGAHQLYNHTDKPCVFVDIRTTAGIDVCEYPDSGKINILPYQEIYQGQDKVGYYLNEDKPAEKWPPEIIRDAAAGD